MKILPLALFIIPFLAGCGANNTPPQTPIPGEKTSAKLRTLETGAAAIQSRPPVDAISTYLDGFHFYSGDKNGQMEAHHYVTVLNEDVMQAVIYDGNTKNARLMGVEYIISEPAATYHQAILLLTRNIFYAASKAGKKRIGQIAG